MSEQLGYLLLLFVVATCNLLLGFALAAHVGRLRLDITWFTISLTGEQLRETSQAVFSWLKSWIPFWGREAPPPADAHPPATMPEPKPASASISEPASIAEPTFPPEPIAATESTTDASLADGWREISAASPDLGRPPALLAAASNDGLSSHDGPTGIEAAAAERPSLAAPPSEPSLPPELADVAAAFFLEPPAPSPAQAPAVMAPQPAAAPQGKSELPPATALPSFESLAGQLDQDLAQLRQEMAAVIRAPVEARPTPEPPRVEPLRARPPESWEAQIESALRENLADLKEAAKVLQAAAALNSVAP